MGNDRTESGKSAGRTSEKYKSIIKMPVGQTSEETVSLLSSLGKFFTSLARKVAMSTSRTGSYLQSQRKAGTVSRLAMAALDKTVSAKTTRDELDELETKIQDLGRNSIDHNSPVRKIQNLSEEDLKRIQSGKDLQSPESEMVRNLGLVEKYLMYTYPNGVPDRSNQDDLSRVREGVDTFLKSLDTLDFNDAELGQMAGDSITPEEVKARINSRQQAHSEFYNETPAVNEEGPDRMSGSSPSTEPVETTASEKTKSGKKVRFNDDGESTSSAESDSLNNSEELSQTSPDSEPSPSAKPIDDLKRLSVRLREMYPTVSKDTISSFASALIKKIPDLSTVTSMTLEPLVAQEEWLREVKKTFTNKTYIKRSKADVDKIIMTLTGSSTEAMSRKPRYQRKKIEPTQIAQMTERIILKSGASPDVQILMTTYASGALRQDGNSTSINKVLEEYDFAALAKRFEGTANVTYEAIRSEFKRMAQEKKEQAATERLDAIEQSTLTILEHIKDISGAELLSQGDKEKLIGSYLDVFKNPGDARAVDKVKNAVGSDLALLQESGLGEGSQASIGTLVEVKIKNNISKMYEISDELSQLIHTSVNGLSETSALNILTEYQRGNKPRIEQEIENKWASGLLRKDVQAKGLEIQINGRPQLLMFDETGKANVVLSTGVGGFLEIELKLDELITGVSDKKNLKTKIEKKINKQKPEMMASSFKEELGLGDLQEQLRMLREENTQLSENLRVVTTETNYDGHVIRENVNEDPDVKSKMTQNSDQIRILEAKIDQVISISENIKSSSTGLIDAEAEKRKLDAELQSYETTEIKWTVTEERGYAEAEEVEKTRFPTEIEINKKSQEIKAKKSIFDLYQQQRERFSVHVEFSDQSEPSLQSSLDSKLRIAKADLNYSEERIKSMNESLSSKVDVTNFDGDRVLGQEYAVTGRPRTKIEQDLATEKQRQGVLRATVEQREELSSLENSKQAMDLKAQLQSELESLSKKKVAYTEVIDERGWNEESLLEERKRRLNPDEISQETRIIRAKIAVLDDFISLSNMSSVSAASTSQRRRRSGGMGESLRKRADQLRDDIRARGPPLPDASRNRDFGMGQ